MKFTPTNITPLHPHQLGTVQFSVANATDIITAQGEPAIQLRLLFENLSGTQMTLNEIITATDAERLGQLMASLGLYKDYARGELNTETCTYRCGFAEIALTPSANGTDWQVKRFLPAADFS